MQKQFTQGGVAGPDPPEQRTALRADRSPRARRLTVDTLATPNPAKRVARIGGRRVLRMTQNPDLALYERVSHVLAA